MKRKDFLRKMRQRRRHDQELEKREPERRRRADWRTVHLDLPPEGDTAEQPTAVGIIELRPDGIRLRPQEPCWVRGYRRWRGDEGEGKAEFQYRIVEEGAEPPPGAVALDEGEPWEP